MALRLDSPRNVHDVLAWRLSAVHTRVGERWICMNPECGCEVFVARTGEFEGASNPRRCSGCVIKKPNVRPMDKELPPVASDRTGTEDVQVIATRIDRPKLAHLHDLRLKRMEVG
jgi:hypothetical protein